MWTACPSEVVAEMRSPAAAPAGTVTSIASGGRCTLTSSAIPPDAPGGSVTETASRPATSPCTAAAAAAAAAAAPPGERGERGDSGDGGGGMRAAAAAAAAVAGAGALLPLRTMRISPTRSTAPPVVRELKARLTSGESEPFGEVKLGLSGAERAGGSCTLSGVTPAMPPDDDDEAAAAALLPPLALAVGGGGGEVAAAAATPPFAAAADGASPDAPAHPRR